jgi:alkanesulfonate monooxygenase SsuD/methylene tetrahydromethanopterin reductase-like flavin-dependent oxidoreductase (luciferase family)
MGSPKTNFYNMAYSRAGYADVCKEVQRLWVEGDRKAAMAAVPEELLLAAYMIGTEDMVRARIRAYRDAGVDCLRLSPEGKGAKAQIENLERTMDLITSETR